jgi:membrane protease YdiL (CAAX protease family)
MSRHCASCGAPRPPAARFCGTCGAPTAEQRRVVHDRVRGERSRTQRAALALGIACAGTLFGLLGGSDDGWAAVLLGSASVFAAAFAAALVLGDLRASCPLAWSWRWCLAAVPTAALSFAVACLIVQLYGGAGGEPPTAAVWVGVVVLAPLGEEWLCRGAAWRAATVLAPPRTALLLTAILFAFLHGLGGGYLLELPHRFVAGLLFGWLRWRSGSLLPGVVAHALHNLAAVWLVA